MPWMQYWLALCGFEWLVVAMAVLHYRDGYFWNSVSQMERRGGRSGNIGYMVEHGGIWGDFIWLSPALSFISVFYADQTRPLLMLGLIGLGGLISVPIFEVWRKEGVQTPNGFARDGNQTTAQAVHFLYMSVAMALIVMFYLSPVTPRDMLIVTGLLMCHVSLGVLQPIYHMTGRIPKATWTIFAAGNGFLIVVALIKIAMFYML